MKHYLKNYYQLSFGLFVHFGLYSIEGKGEWLYHVGENVDPEEYFSLKDKFNVYYLCYDEGLKKIEEEGVKVIYIKNKYFSCIALFLTYLNTLLYKIFDYDTGEI